MTDPIGLWEAIYPFEETIAVEHDTVERLQRSLDSDGYIADQVGRVQAILARLHDDIARLYSPWSTQAASYKFPMEVSMQTRVLALIERLEQTRFRGQSKGIAICARQIVKPSAFNGSPRVKRFPGVAFIVFPAASTCWMYVLIELMVQGLDGEAFDQARLDEYLRYLVAARSFEKWSTPSTAYALDFVIDRLVFGGEGVNENGWQARISPLSANMVFGAESFILCHEMAHLSLEHGEVGTADAEAEADNMALGMLRAIGGGSLILAECEGLDAQTIPLLGYLTLRLWTNVRLAAEMRILPYVLESPAEIEAKRSEIGKKFDARARQIGKVQEIKNLPAYPLMRSLTAAAGRLVQAILDFPIDHDRAASIRALAKSLALDDYGVLSERLYTKTRRNPDTSDPS